jgi:hypothetical protein
MRSENNSRKREEENFIYDFWKKIMKNMLGSFWHFQTAWLKAVSARR